MLRRTRSSEDITGNRYYPLCSPFSFPSPHPPKARPFDGFERPPQFCIREPSSEHLVSPLSRFPGDRVSSSTIVAKSNDRQMINLARPRNTCRGSVVKQHLRRSIPRTYISQTLRGAKETSLSWRATKKNISGRSVHVQLLRRRGIWMNTFSPR